MFRDLVSGRSRGVASAALRGLLAAAEPLYAAAVRSKNRKFDTGRLHPIEVPAPVISVGNLTVGGTGKTPFVAWLAKWFQSRGAQVTLISRGYKAHRGRPNDEALELAARLPDVPHLQNPDRVTAALQALAQNPRQVLLLDDAFQHRRIARDLDFVLLDALAPFGYERLLPRGLLREPVEGLKRAQAVALSRADAIDPASREQIRARVQGIAPQVVWFELSHRPTGLVNASGRRIDPADLNGQSVAAFCGIGNPAGFRYTLETIGLCPAAWHELADHCPYSPADIAALNRWLGALPGMAAVLCTRKDLVKIPRDTLADLPLWAVEIELNVSVGQAELEAMLDRVAAKLNVNPDERQSPTPISAS